MQDADYFLENYIRARSQNTNIMKKTQYFVLTSYGATEAALAPYTFCT